jgi:hypothetical protein
MDRPLARAMTSEIIMAKSTTRTNSLASIPGTVVLIGAGKMGGALLDGWLSRKLGR